MAWPRLAVYISAGGSFSDLLEPRDPVQPISQKGQRLGDILIDSISVVTFSMNNKW
jgi:hypothetical protein